ncbi:caspase family protein [Leptolyngbya sp. O-77]|uniref:caspase family protein n=1 Tax=Leptolyngbya sp. O-77 TaxID=1080068 RepID=UPI00074D4400|nr:caspase family protein [Leptolyngbya sp. O-77]BAU44061.1 Caspase domain protein [Leptolyngbya sp. O-77]
MGLTRREFLQRSSGAIAIGGALGSGLWAWGDRAGRVLAAPTSRKLALLIGISQYPEAVSDIPPMKGGLLPGALTDVEMQRQVLQHRFGFRPADILTLTDEQATWAGITDAFQAHLLEQAKPGDVVVVHLSGLGSRVRSATNPEQLWDSIVPIDGGLPTSDRPLIADLTRTTLEQLVRSLPTSQVVTLLDLGFSNLGTSLQGNLRIRARPNAPTGDLHSREIALQETLGDRLRAAKATLSGPLPGLFLTAAASGQAALEGRWSGFSAGLLTYALTQYLWDATAGTALSTVLTQTSSSIKRLSGANQEPQANGTLSRDGTSAYPLVPAAAGADGVILVAPDSARTLRLWAGGLPPSALSAYSPGSLWETIDSDPQLLRVQGRDGLTLKVLPVIEGASLKPGQPVQERVRLLPRSVGLTIALDSSLDRIERVDATSAFTAAKVSLVNVGEQSADYLFGKRRAIETTVAAVSLELPDPAVQTDVSPAQPVLEMPSPTATPNGKYGLFYPGRVPLGIELSTADEAVKTAVNRLTPQLRSLFAMKLLRLTVNASSSRLSVRASLEQIAPGAAATRALPVVQQETVSIPNRLSSKRTPTAVESGAPVPAGSTLRYRLQNAGDQPLYGILIGLDNTGQAIALPLSTSTEQPLLSPGSTLTLPAEPSPGWVVPNAPGLAEMFLILSVAPFSHTLAGLPIAPGATPRQAIALTNPLDVAQSILQDLHEATPVSGDFPGDFPSDTYALDVTRWATLHLMYRVEATA